MSENCWYFSAMDRASNPVPRYALFGESTGAAFEDMVHCETIEARSSRYEWEITPHRHPSLYQLLLVLDGSVDLMMNGHHTHLEKAVLLLFPPGTVHGFRFAPTTQGFVVTLSDGFAGALQADEGLRTLLARPDVVDLVPDIAVRMRAICEQMLLAEGGGRAADLLRRALAEALVRIAAELGASSSEQPSDELVDGFRRLVQRHLADQPDVQFFARSLSTTERTLSRRVRAALGMSPGQYLNERIAAEATRLLRFTNAGCKEVADELGFADPSYFSRFYARITGRRPSVVKGSD